MLCRAVQRVAQLCDADGRLEVDLAIRKRDLSSDVQLLLVNDLLNPVEINPGVRGTVLYCLTRRAKLFADMRPLRDRPHAPRSASASVGLPDQAVRR